MKKLFAIIFSLFLSLNAAAQEKYNIYRIDYHGELMIQISLHNLVAIIKMSNVNFESLMAEDNYKINPLSGDNYVWQNRAAGGVFTIGKSPGSCNFIWSEDDISLSQLKDDLEKYYSYTKDGESVYSMSIDGMSYILYLSNRHLLIKKVH